MTDPERTLTDLADWPYPRDYEYKETPIGRAHTNLVRAGCAAQALLAYPDATGDSTIRDALTDLLIDLHHLAVDQGIKFDDAVHLADVHYREERVFP